MTAKPSPNPVRQSAVTSQQERRKQVLAERLHRARSGISGPGPRPADAIVPLGPAQTGLWVEDRMDPGSAAYVVGFGLRVQGPVDQQQIRDACRALTARYDILRASYPADDRGETTVMLHEDIGVELPVMDLRDADDPLSAAETEFSRTLATPFDVAAGPLARFHSLTLADDDHVVLLTAHHLIVDGWSVELLKSHLRQALEQAAHNGSIDLGARPLQYEDIAVYEATVARAARRAAGREARRNPEPGTRCRQASSSHHVEPGPHPRVHASGRACRTTQGTGCRRRSHLLHGHARAVPGATGQAQHPTRFRDRHTGGEP